MEMCGSRRCIRQHHPPNHQNVDSADYSEHMVDDFRAQVDEMMWNAATNTRPRTAKEFRMHKRGMLLLKEERHAHLLHTHHVTHQQRGTCGCDTRSGSTQPCSKMPVHGHHHAANHACTVQRKRARTINKPTPVQILEPPITTAQTRHDTREKNSSSSNRMRRSMYAPFMPTGSTLGALVHGTATMRGGMIQTATVAHGPFAFLHHTAARMVGMATAHTGVGVEGVAVRIHLHTARHGCQQCTWQHWVCRVIPSSPLLH